jgi:nitroimidazol reductase NimA-like FMN-containing flavoprotein (pyridoxamine 5'-phosphate oxidase superfamily)
MIIEEMARLDCLSMLAHARLGRLACAWENQPYVVPLYFVYQEPYLYSFTTPGQKVQWMRANPLICVELDEVDDYDEWTSIVIFGRYEELPDTPEWRPELLRGHELLQEHARWWETGCASRTLLGPEQALAPVFFRICISRVTGRRATPDRVGPERTGTVLPKGARQGWFHKLSHAPSKLLRRGR